MDIQLGYWRWKLFRWNEHPNPYRNRPDLALSWLTRFQNDPAVMSDLRNLLGASITDPQTILQQIAGKLSSGEIYVCMESCGPVSLTAEATEAQEQVEPDLSQMRAQSSPAPPPAPPPAPESTLGPATDAAATAQVLKDAARDGVPFCEECEKARAAHA
jgi:hypothetical protein